MCVEKIYKSNGGSFVCDVMMSIDRGGVALVGISGGGKSLAREGTVVQRYGRVLELCERLCTSMQMRFASFESGDSLGHIDLVGTFSSSFQSSML
jgi:hypothetical protein